MPTVCADWMAECQDALRDLPLCQVPLPGSHDAGSFGGINAKSKTQEYSIKDQLEYGVRYFDFRVRVDNGQFFSHHGADESRDNPYAQWPTEQSDANGKIFIEIVQFCDQHPGEIVILNFTDFSAVWNQSFNDDDKRHFMDRMRARFDNRMVLREDLGDGSYGNTIPTYGQCIDRGQRIFVIINEDVPVWRAHQDIWPAIGCWRDRFSAYSYSGHTWAGLIELTMQDQQDYLTDAHAADGRALDHFWVSQAILDYPALAPDGKSRNWYGAEKLNPPFMDAFTQWWNGESAFPSTPATVKRPNILLLDFSGVFDNLPQVCKALLGH
ncbi:MAG: hypothetical protein M3326_02355 [Actinomycetota bacterium]|nr:hypothetical protein [Actinomycetota bacterium]